MEYLERRNRQIFVMVERRNKKQKAVARLFGLKYDHVRQILSRMRRRLALAEARAT